MKKIVSAEERALQLLKIRVSSKLVGKYDVRIHPSDVGHLALVMKSLIEFESPRFLIQEVAKVGAT